MTKPVFEYLYKQYRAAMRGAPPQMIVPRTIFKFIMEDANTVAEGEVAIEKYIANLIEQMMEEEKKRQGAANETIETNTASSIGESIQGSDSSTD